MSSNGPRPERGILSEDDRKLLLNISDITEGTRYNRRADVRERVEHGIRDFSLLFSHLNDRDREKVAGEIGMVEWADAPDHSLFAGSPPGMVAAIAFLYRLHRDVFAAENATQRFEETVGLGVAAALKKELGEQWNADVKLTLERPATRETITEKWRDGGTEALNGPEAKRLLDAQKELRKFTGGSEVPFAPTDVFDRLDVEREKRKAIREEIQRGISEGALTFDRLARLTDEGVPGIEAFPEPREVEARRGRTPYDDIDDADE